MPISNRPIFTDKYDDLASFTPDGNSAYIFGRSVEERSERSEEWDRKCNDVLFVPITEQKDSEFTYVAEGNKVVRLRSGIDLRDFWRSLERPKVYLDITGLDHHVWAPLFKSALSVGVQVFAMYLEPAAYRFSPLPREGDIFDLSERIKGMAPLPGFATLGEARHEEEVTLVVLLGFEGVRFKYCLACIIHEGGGSGC